MPDPVLAPLRWAFSQAVAKLVQQAEVLGFHVAINEVVRGPAQVLADAKSGAGIITTLHAIGLAVDLLLFDAEGVYLVSTEQYRPLGTYWKTLHPLARWGGDFTTRPDGDHFSFEYQGRQ
jgi:hypothetical protein